MTNATRFLLLLLSCTLACAPSSKTEKLPRIAIAGIGIESSTFSPARTHEEAFHARVGTEIFERYSFFNDSSDIRQRAEWIPTFLGKALPGGVVTKDAYESMVGKLLGMLKEQGPFDGLWFDIHGAMSVEGMEDAEGDLIKRIREVIGTQVLISTSMDLHGNVSKELAHHSDLITCYRKAPHEDAIESKERSIQNLLERLETGAGKPAFKAWIPVPILLPGEKTSTRIEPGKGLYAQIPEITAKTGVMDAAIWVGYAWGDEARSTAVVMAYGDEKNAVKNGAEQLANSFWERRHEFDFVAPTTTFEQSITQAINSSSRPYIISDMGDNPTAGGAGDVTWTLQEILKIDAFKDSKGPSLIYASIPGPQLIEQALSVGVGGKVNAVVGAEVDARFAPPLPLQGKVTAIKKGDRDAEVEVVVQVGSVSVIVTKKRKPYHHIEDFTSLKLDPTKTAILVVKIGYLVPELYDIRGDWSMALTPGGVDQDLERLGYRFIKRPMFPLDSTLANPNLEAQFIALSHESLKP